MRTSDRKYQRLCQILEDLGKVAVAFSGGVDSSFLFKTAVDVLGDRAVAFHVSSPLQSAAERPRASELAGTIGGRLIVCQSSPLDWPEFVANPPDRCYHCKRRIYGLLREQAAIHPDAVLADGTNADDLHQHRPGLRAVRELGIKTPLAEAGLTKPEIRRFSRALQLPSWNQFPSSCLATRIATGLEITAARLTIVDRAEDFLRDLGLHGCRTRLFAEEARIELCRGDLGKLADDSLRDQTLSFLLSLGFKKVFLDLSPREGVEV